MKKKIDERIRILIENCVKTNHRSLILIVGDRGLYQVVNLHYMLTKARVKAQPNVLWCYKKDLEISSNKKKRLKQIKKLESKGNLDKEEINQIELFMSSKEIKFCYYKDTHRILGQTYGMCVLQDFESLTPNVLCRTLETVEGGGICIMLFNTMTSLKQLYEISMDVHSRYRTDAHQVVEPRFNERFLLSLSNCKTCLAIDDELNILPITQHIKDIKEVKLPGMERKDGEIQIETLYLTDEQKQLRDLKQSLKDTKPIGNLVNKCKTLDQARSVMSLVDSISEKNLKVTISLTAGRGRGKSAALGISIAGAIVYGFSNIFVTAPSPENLGTLFDFIFAGLDALNYKEHQDYEILQSTNPEFNHAVVRVNIFRDHRQTIQYIRPQDHAKLSQAELLVVDEAAAIPITLVKQLLGPYMVILSSTIHGYEGTGRSLSLKLLSSLKGQTRVTNNFYNKNQSQGEQQLGRALKEVQLDEPIRYGNNDPIEKWLNDLLCLDATKEVQQLTNGFPHPHQCELYYVNRDTLFSYHSSTEKFLSKIMNIFVSSHYKNTPNDLQLLSDAPAHAVFVLLGPLSEASTTDGLPDILCAIQVCFEGEINKQTISDHLKRGLRPSGDLIPWTVSEQFQDQSFASLSGIRVVRIATHPNAQGKGYGSRALEQLLKYYEGQLIDFDNIKTDEQQEMKNRAQNHKTSESKSLTEEKIKPKKHVLPILQKLSERKPAPLHYIGTSFGVTKELFQFWRKNMFVPIYLRQTANELTGEHTCVMIRPINLDDEAVKVPDSMKAAGVADDSLPVEETSWISSYYLDFKKRLLNLFGFEFRELPCSLAFQFIGEKNQNQGSTEATEDQGIIETIKREDLEKHISLFDLRRLDSYSKNMVDFHLVLDLVPTLAKLFYTKQTLPRGCVNLSYVQSAILIGLGLQYKKVEDIEKDLGLNSSQILPQFNKVMRKFTRVIKSVIERDIEKAIDQESKANQEMAQKQIAITGMQTSLDDDEEGDTKLVQQMKEDKHNFLKKHAVKSAVTNDTIGQALKNMKATSGQIPSIVSIPVGKREAEDDVSSLEEKVNYNQKRGKKVRRS